MVNPLSHHMQISLLETLLKAKKKKKTCAHINFTYLPHIDKFCDTGEKKWIFCISIIVQ